MDLIYNLLGRAVTMRPDDDGNVIRTGWDRLARKPGGKRVFSAAIGRYAAYTGTIGAVVTELEMGRSVVAMPDRRKVRNHLQTVHAAALVNLVEFTGNVALGYSMPPDARLIVAGLTVDYVKKARGTITGYCNCEIPDGSARHEYQVPVSLRDEQGDEVVRASLRVLVGPKKKS